MKNSLPSPRLKLGCWLLPARGRRKRKRVLPTASAPQPSWRLDSLKKTLPGGTGLVAVAWAITSLAATEESGKLPIAEKSPPSSPATHTSESFLSQSWEALPQWQSYVEF